MKFAGGFFPLTRSFLPSADPTALFPRFSICLQSKSIAVYVHGCTRLPLSKLSIVLCVFNQEMLLIPFYARTLFQLFFFSSVTPSLSSQMISSQHFSPNVPEPLRPGLSQLRYSDFPATTAKNRKQRRHAVRPPCGLTQLRIAMSVHNATKMSRTSFWPNRPLCPVTFWTDSYTKRNAALDLAMLVKKRVNPSLSRQSSVRRANHWKETMPRELWREVLIIWCDVSSGQARGVDSRGSLPWVEPRMSSVPIFQRHCAKNQCTIAFSSLFYFFYSCFFSRKKKRFFAVHYCHSVFPVFSFVACHFILVSRPFRGNSCLSNIIYINMFLLNDLTCLRWQGNSANGIHQRHYNPGRCQLLMLRKSDLAV